VTATPLQVAELVATAAVGKRMRPRFVMQIETPDGDVVEATQPEVVEELHMRESTLMLIREAMRDVVQAPHGTGRNARLKDIEVAGKTGTSQVVKLGKKRRRAGEIPWRYRDHAWFAAYAPVAAPQIAVAVLVEHAGAGGGAVAAPVARQVLQRFFELQEQRREKRYAQNRSTPDRPL
jgi:penicillin-binding protein 2